MGVSELSAKVFLKVNNSFKQLTVFIVDEKQCFWSTKSRFLKDRVTLKNGVMMLRIQLSHHKLHFKTYQIRKQLI